MCLGGEQTDQWSLPGCPHRCRVTGRGYRGFMCHGLWVDGSGAVSVG